MKALDHLSGILEEDANCLLRLLKEWQPRSFELSELEHETDLESWLKQKAPGIPLITQYGLARGKIDIVIDNKYAIELKLGLTSANEFKRCLGQIEEYRKLWTEGHRGYVYLVIIGNSHADYLAHLKELFEKLNADKWLLLAPDRFNLIEKPTK